MRNQELLDLRLVYEQFASGKTLWRSLMNERVRRLILEEPILDLGAGEHGTSSYHQLINGFETMKVASVDISPEKRPTKVADIEIGIPFGNDEFRTCLAFNLFEHLYRFDQVFGEAWRVLAPGGRLYIAVPFLFRVHADPSDYYRYTQHCLERKLMEAGFGEIVIEPQGGGAVTAALAQVDFLVPKIARRLALRISLSMDARITKRSGGLYRNARDYPIGYFVTATKS
jgi:SAM-dependent methyltransferase